MRKTVVFALIILSVAGMCLAQTQFASAVGGTEDDYAQSVIQTSDGGYAAAGYTSSFGAGNNDLFLVKFDSTGSIDWARAVGGADDDYGSSVVQTMDGGYAVTGYTSGFGAASSNFFLVKFDSIGSMDWAKVISGMGNDKSYSVIQTPDSGYVLGGSTGDVSAVTTGLFLGKFSSSGSAEWAKIVGGSGLDYGYFAIQTSDGGYAVTGDTRSFGLGCHDLFLAKIDCTGWVEWVKVVGGTACENGRSVTQTTDGGYVVVGPSLSFSVGGNDLFVVKFTSSGSVDWARSIGGTAEDVGFSVMNTIDSGCVMTGYTESFGAGDCDLFIVKLTSSGYIDWVRSVGGTAGDIGASVIQTTDNGYAVAGYTESFGMGNKDLFLVRFDGDGNTCMGGNVIPMALFVTPDVLSPWVGGVDMSLTTTDVSVAVSDVVPVVTEICSGDYISETSPTPQSFELSAYPNPFNSACRITVEQTFLFVQNGQTGMSDLPTVEIFDINGRMVAEMSVNNPVPSANGRGDRAPTNETVIWTPDKSVGSGVYLVRARVGGGATATKRVVYLK